MATLKRNFFYSFFLTTSNYLMSLVVFPYVSRVLGPSNLGLVGYFEGTVGVFTLLATMGMNFLGIREISCTKSDPHKISTAYTSLLVLSGIFSLIAICGYLITCIAIPTLRSHPIMITFGALSILAQVFIMDWFYKGLENFKYITIRNLFVKAIYIVAVFLTVTDSDNYLIYFILIVATYTINSAINLIYSHKFTTFSLKGIKLRRYIKPYLSLGTYSLLSSLYITFNPMFLGIVTNDTQVGYYSVSVKVFMIILSSFTALTAVLMPRMSVMLSNKETENFISNTTRTINVFISLAIPISILGLFYSPEIVRLISGDNYSGAVLPMQILMPLLFINGLGQIAIIQILMPMNLDRSIMRNSRIVGIVAILLNFLFVGSLGAIGSAIVWTLSECILLILSMRVVYNATEIRIPWRQITYAIISSMPCIAALYVITEIQLNQWFQSLTGCLTFLLIYFIMQLFIIKNENIKFIIRQISYRKTSAASQSNNN